LQYIHTQEVSCIVTQGNLSTSVKLSL